MNRRLLTIKRSLVLLALGGATFGFLGTSFGGDTLGCNYARYADYETWYTAAGQAVIQGVSDGLLGGIGTDFDNLIRNPATALAQSSWGNWVDTRVPDDLPTNAVVLR